MSNDEHRWQYEQAVRTFRQLLTRARRTGDPSRLLQAIVVGRVPMEMHAEILAYLTAAPWTKRGGRPASFNDVRRTALELRFGVLNLARRRTWSFLVQTLANEFEVDERTIERQLKRLGITDKTRPVKSARIKA